FWGQAFSGPRPDCAPPVPPEGYEAYDAWRPATLFAGIMRLPTQDDPLTADLPLFCHRFFDDQPPGALGYRVDLGWPSERDPVYDKLSVIVFNGMTYKAQFNQFAKLWSGDIINALNRGTSYFDKGRDSLWTIGGTQLHVNHLPSEWN